MAFNYQSLKNITDAAIIAGSLTGDDFNNLAISDTKIANTTITSAELGTGSVVLTSTAVTGATPFNKGGTGASAVGSAYRVLAANSANTALEFAPTGIYRMVVFTGSGTYTKTSGVRYIWVQVQGPGGGASGHGESGAAGGYAERLIDATGITTVSVTVNGGGGGTYYSGAAGNAAGSSFGAYVSASGGHGANRHNQHNGGLPGVGSGGDLNIYGGAGGGHEQRSSGMGGSSFWGGPAPSGHPQGGNFTHNHQGHSAPGTGGTAGYFSGHRGSDGRPGLIVVTEFF